MPGIRFPSIERLQQSKNKCVKCAGQDCEISNCKKGTLLCSNCWGWHSADHKSCPAPKARNQNLFRQKQQKNSRWRFTLPSKTSIGWNRFFETAGLGNRSTKIWFSCTEKWIDWSKETEYTSSEKTERAHNLFSYPSEKTTMCICLFYLPMRHIYMHPLTLQHQPRQPHHNNQSHNNNRAHSQSW